MTFLSYNSLIETTDDQNFHFVISCIQNTQFFESPFTRSSKLRRFLSEDPSSSSSSVHFQMPKNLQSFEDFRLKITKIFWENLTIFWTKLSEKVQKYVLFLKL